MPDVRHEVAAVEKWQQIGDRSDLSCSKMLLGTSYRTGQGDTHGVARHSTTP